MPISKDPIVIVSAARTATGRFGGVFKDIPTPELGAIAIKAAVERAQLTPDQIEEVLMGCVLPAGLGQAPARQAALLAGLPQSTACTTVNKMCGSGMKTVMQAHDALIAGSHNIIVAGGMENMSRAPYLLKKARFGYRLGRSQIYDHMMLDGLEDAYEKGRSMGEFAEATAEAHNLSRDLQDDFAIQSLERALQATEMGFFTEEIVGHVRQDEGPLHAKPEKIPQLKPAFKKDGTVTAANSSSISDGAAALVLMRQSHAQALKLKPLAKIIGHHSHAKAPNEFTTAPIDAIKGLLQKIDWESHDVDLFEINEAFAVVTLVTMNALGLDHAKVNINGGACVLGHPIGASGARIIVTLLHALKQHNLTKGIAALCIGGGEATAIAIEL